MPDQNQPGHAPQPADAASTPPLCSGLPDDHRPDLSAHIVTLSGNGGRFISEEMARLMLTDVAHFLRQVVSITSHVVQSINVGQLRRIVGPELARSIGLIDENGKIVTEHKEPEAPADEPAPSTPSTGSGQAKRDHRKGPRGGKHPMVVLIQIALQAGKLLERITRGMAPHAYNIEHYQSRIDRAEQREANRNGVREVSEFAGIAKNLEAAMNRSAAIKR